MTFVINQLNESCEGKSYSFPRRFGGGFRKEYQPVSYVAREPAFFFRRNALLSLTGLAERTMTVKEVAEVLGVTAEAIKWHVRSLYPELLKNGIETRLTELQVTEIKRKMIPTSQLVGAVTEIEKEETIALAMQYMQERYQKALAKVQALEPRAELADALTNSNGAISMAEAVKILELPIGRNTAYAILREYKILQQDNVPYQEYMNRGYFRVKESLWKDSDGQNHITTTTEIYQKGMEYLRNFFKEKLA